jgi:hypothetical protein
MDVYYEKRVVVRRKCNLTRVMCSRPAREVAGREGERTRSRGGLYLSGKWDIKCRLKKKKKAHVAARLRR